MTAGVISLVSRLNYDKCVDSGTLTPNQTIDPHNSECPSTTVSGARSYANKQHDRARIYGTTFFGVGAAAVAVATYIYLTAPQRERINQTVWVPTVAPDGVGLAAVGHF